jgi:hypothetical protein
MLQRIKGIYLRKSSIEKCRHPKTTTLSMIAIISSSFFLYAQLVRNGDPLLGVINVLSLLVFFLLVEPNVNALLPIKRVRIFDKKPPLLFFFASALIFLVLAIAILSEFIPIEGGHMILKDYSSLFTAARYSVALLIIGLILLLTWPYVRKMDLTIDIERVQQ